MACARNLLMLIRHGCMIVLAMCAGVGSVQAQGAAYRIDPVHTRVVFAIDHAGFSRAIGTVSGSTGTLWFDANDWRSAKVDVQIPMTRIDLGDAAWNRATLATNLLDAQRHPIARFISNRIEPIDATHARICGTLSLRGQARDTCLDATLNQLKRHPMPPFRMTAGFSATAQLSRKQFGIDAWPGMIGDAVDIRIELEAVRTRGNADTIEAGSQDITSPESTP